ncbi:MAG: hypothetical protein ACR2KQ_01845 [Actinomycetota bacterium]
MRKARLSRAFLHEDDLVANSAEAEDHRVAGLAGHRHEDRPLA